MASLHVWLVEGSVAQPFLPGFYRIEKTIRAPRRRFFLDHQRLTVFFPARK
jgi:hypothetical protein